LAEYARQYNASQDQYDLVLRSGLRGPGQRFHTSGEAVDINLVDRRNGERLTDYQTRDPVVFKAYQDNANQFHQFLQQNYPDLAQQHRWGGYFWNGGPGKYGSQDIMHHDLGGNRIGMAAGSWKGGLSQRSADAYGLPTGGGSDTPWPKFNFDWSNAPIPDAAPMSPTYKSAGGTRVYQLAPDGTRLPVPIISGNNPSELPSRDFGGSVGPPRPPGDIPAAAPALGRRSDLGASDATEFSSQSRRAAPDRGMDPSYWADVLADDAEPSEGAGLNERSTGMALPAGLDAFFTGDVPKFDPTTFQSPANDYNTFQQQQPGRDQLAQRMNFSGFSPSPEPRQGGVGPEMDAPTSEFLRTIAEAESSSNPNKQDKGSQYSGLFQLNKPEFRKYGGTGSIYDADENTKAATGKMMAEGQQAQDILGRALSPVEQYMVHQQGLAGTVSHLRNPDQPAWKSFQQASKWSDERAKTAIWGNLSNNQKAQFGNDVNNITSRDYIELWANKYLEKQVESGQPMTFPGGFSRD
jgi:hypothetical protein